MGRGEQVLVAGGAGPWAHQRPIINGGSLSRLICKHTFIYYPRMTQNPLAAKVAVVAGATRGAGRGIARMLGEAGAIVYCFGRRRRDKANTAKQHHAGPTHTHE